MIGGKCAPPTFLSNEDADMDSTITTFNTSVTETASEILNKHCQKKKPWVTADVLDLCDEGKDLRKKKKKEKKEHGGSEKYREVTNNIKKRTKKAKRKLNRRTA